MTDLAASANRGRRNSITKPSLDDGDERKVVVANAQRARRQSITNLHAFKMVRVTCSVLVQDVFKHLSPVLVCFTESSAPRWRSRHVIAHLSGGG